MPTQLTDTLLSSTYKDDFKDSNNFHRILFNSGRALQARELTQMQTIIQREMERFGKNIFKEGAAVNPGGLLLNKRYEFIKLDTATNPLPTDATILASIVGSEFTGQTSQVKFVVLEVVQATSTDPATLYVRYTDTSSATSGETSIRVSPAENISSSAVTLTVQTTNTTTNPASGTGCRASVHGGDFFAQGHFINVQPQSILLSKYAKNPTKTVGFKVIEDVVSTQDDTALFDNQGAVPNVTAPGADRLRIRLELTTQDVVDSSDNFIFFSEVVNGTVMQTVTGFDQYNKINDVLAVRGKETNGDFNVKTFRLKFDEKYDKDSALAPGIGTLDDTKLVLGVSPGTAYVNGYRANVPVPTRINVDKAQDTIILNNEISPATYGNYVDVFGDFSTQTGSMIENNSHSSTMTANSPDLLSAKAAFNINKLYRVELRRADQWDSDIYSKGYASNDTKTGDDFANYNVFRACKTGRTKSNGYNISNKAFRVKSAITDIALSGNDIKITVDSNGVKNRFYASGTARGGERRPGSLQNGSQVYLSGIDNGGAANDARLNGQRFYVGDLDSATNQFTLYADADLTTKIDNSASSKSINQTSQVVADASPGANAAADWGTIGFAHVRYVEKMDNIRYRLYLQDVQMHKGQSFRDVRSLGTNNDFCATIIPETISNATQLKGTANNTLLFPMRNPRIKTLTDISLEVQRYFEIDMNSNSSATVQLTATGEAFANASQIVAVNKTLKRPAQGTFVIQGSGNNTLQYTIGGSETNTDVIGVIAKVARTAGAVRSKTLTLYPSITLNPDSYHGSPIVPQQYSLRRADVHSIEFITDANGDSTDLSSKFIFDGGQRDNFYDNGRLILKGGFTQNDPIKVRFRYFYHGTTGDFFAPQSYSTIDYSAIPTHELTDGTIVDLRSAIDFRPRKANHKIQTNASAGLFANKQPGYGNYEFGFGLAEGNQITYDDSSNTGHVIPLITNTDFVQADAEVYMPRHDLLTLNQAGEVVHVKGVSNLDPKFPELPDRSLELYQIKMQPFTINDSDLSTELVETRGYTMKDIGSIEKRVNRVEELTALSLLELDLKSFSVLDSTGADRTKSGFLVDNFRDHLSSDPGNIEHQSAIDPTTQIMRPSFNEDAVNLVYDSDASTNTVLKGDNIYLKYNHVKLLDQPIYSQTENINPFQVIVHRGKMRLSPGSDDWTEVKRLPPKIIDGGFRLNPRMNGLWQRWGWGWGGQKLNTAEGSSLLGQTKTDGWRNRSNNWQSGNTAFTQTWQQRTRARVVEGETLREFIEDKVVDVAVIPWARSRFISFQARGLRPNTRVFPYFDGVRVDQWVRESDFIAVADARGTSRINAQSGAGMRPSNLPGSRFNRATSHPKGSSNLIADAKGEVTGSFFLPNTDTIRFKSGEREFKLLDITVDNEKDAASIGRGIYTATGILETRQRNFRSTRTLDLNTSQERQNVQTFSTNLSDDDDDGQSDPLAQSFVISVPNGCFCTKVGFRFATKDAVIPVQCQLRPMVNGHPSSTEVLPGASKFLEPSLVNTSTDGLTLTYFEWDEPVYLNSGVEYSVVLLAESIDYNVYVAQTGEFIFGSTEKKITKQPSMGSMFKSQNGSTWEPAQNFDMAFELHIAEFVRTGSAFLQNQHPPQELLGIDPFSITSGDKTVTVYQPDHGFKRTDRVHIDGVAASIAGVPSAWFNTVTSGTLGTPHTITNAENDYYQFELHGAAPTPNLTTTGGGSSVFADKNVPFQVAWLNLQTLVPPTCALSAQGKFTSAQSIAQENPSADYAKDGAYSVLALGQNNYFPGPRMIPSETNNNNNIGVGLKSTDILVDMTNGVNRVSPVIDMQRASLWCIHNRIDWKDASSGGTYMDGAQGNQVFFTPETDENGGTSIAKHITRTVELEVDAVGLKVFLAVNRPSAAAFDLYHKTTTDDGDLRVLPWVYQAPEADLAPDDDPDVFREYEFTIGGQGGNLEPFTKYQLKIVMKSFQQQAVPSFRDLRVISMGT